MITHILAEFIDDEGMSQNRRLIPVLPEKDFYIKVGSILGELSILKEEQLCRLCKGTGGIRYWYEQDHSVSVACPICNGGDQKEWDREKARWEHYRNGC